MLVDQNTFDVQSQTNPEKYYAVTRTSKGLVYQCPDHTYSHSDCKHIKAVLEKLRKNKGYTNAVFRVMARSQRLVCKFCDSGSIVKAGIKKNKNNSMQRYRCQDCKKRFSTNYGFEGKRFDPKIITQAIQMYYLGMSVRGIADSLEIREINVTSMTVHNWISQYAKLASSYIDNIVPRTQNRFMVHADEIYMKVKGEQKYLFASMEADSRFWLAADMTHSKYLHDGKHLLDMTKRQLGGRVPTHFTTDKSPVYPKASKRAFGKKTNHIQANHLRAERHNNKQERLNGTIRDREKVMRCFKKIDANIIPGMRVNYNYCRKHQSLDGKTLSEKALINVDSKDKWFALIQNASLYRIHE